MLETLGRLASIEKRLDGLLPASPVTLAPRWLRIRSVRDCIRELSPAFDVPEHLAPYLDALDGCLHHESRLVFHAPPQHGKTEALSHGFISWAINDPGKRHAYATYNDDRTREILDRVKFLAFEAGLDPTTRKGLLRLSGGTEIKFTSATGSLTGRPIDGVLAVDDPIKSAEDARSPRYRDLCWRFLIQTGQLRLHPGASVIIMMTRWHPDDMAGRCIEAGYEFVRLAAIAELDDILGRDLGAALWPAHRPLEFLEEQKRAVGVHVWASMFQGLPRAAGAEVFGTPTFYDDLPRGRYQVAYGMDCAYTAKTSADYSVLVKMVRVMEKTADGDVRPHFFVPDVWRLQVESPRFLGTVKAALARQPGRVRWYIGGTEKGTADFMRREVPMLETPTASGDKFVRAHPLSVAWNDGRVLLRSGAPWAGAVEEELCAFTGAGDAHDDIADAMSAAYDVLSESSSTRGPRTIRIAPRM